MCISASILWPSRFRRKGGIELALEKKIKEKVRMLLRMRGDVLDPSNQPRVIRVNQPTAYAPLNIDAIVQRDWQLGIILPPPFLPHSSKQSSQYSRGLCCFKSASERRDWNDKVSWMRRGDPWKPLYCPFCGEPLKQLKNLRGRSVLAGGRPGWCSRRHSFWVSI